MTQNWDVKEMFLKNISLFFFFFYSAGCKGVRKCLKEAKWKKWCHYDKINMSCELLITFYLFSWWRFAAYIGFKKKLWSDGTTKGYTIKVRWSIEKHISGALKISSLPSSFYTPPPQIQPCHWTTKILGLFTVLIFYKIKCMCHSSKPSFPRIALGVERELSVTESTWEE